MSSGNRFHRPLTILAICAVSIGALTAALWINAAQKSGDARTGTAQSALSIGLTTSHSIVTASQRVGISAELINTSAHTLTLDGPIEISGTGGESGVHVLYAQVVKDDSSLSGVPTAAPPALESIPPNEHVTAAIGLELDCALWSARGEWPSAHSTATIGLAGFEKPAIYSVTDLFGSDIASQIRELCSET